MGPKLAPLAPLKGSSSPALAPIGAVSNDEARTVFDQLDINKDGKLQKEELRKGLWKLSVSGEGASVDTCAATYQSSLLPRGCVQRLFAKTCASAVVAHAICMDCSQAERCGSVHRPNVCQSRLEPQWRIVV